MATLISKVRNLSQTTTSETSDAVVGLFCSAGAIFVVNAIPTALLSFMGTDSTNITSSTGYDVLNDRVIMVRRNGIVCDELPKEKIYAYSGALTTTSLFKGSAIFPKFYIQQGLVYIKPDPTTGAIGLITSIAVPAITSATTTTVLDEIENPLVLYAAALDCMAASSYWSAKSLASLFDTAGDARDALDKAKALVDSSTLLSQGEDAEYFLAQEDAEMIASNIQIAAQEVNRALAEMRDTDSAKQYSMEYLERSNMLFKQAQVELDLYVNRNARMLELNTMLQANRGREE
jgi:hypothetical protein